MIARGPVAGGGAEESQIRGGVVPDREFVVAARAQKTIARRPLHGECTSASDVLGFGGTLDELADNADINASLANISLGIEAPGGFSGADLVSPAQAVAVGALADQRFTDGEPTEFRIHGVSGSDGPTMLQHPHVVQVAGRSPTAIYRRWDPCGRGRLSVPRPLEAYSWGGLTERPLAAASWIVLTAFMLYNVAFFMLPAGGAKPGCHRWARRIMRLLALAATAQFVNAAVIVLVSTIGWQNAATRSGSPGWWIGWYTRLDGGPRVGLALVMVGLIVGCLWLASVRTVRRYEKREMSVTAGGDHGWKLRKPGFWHGAAVVARQRNLHVGAAFAFAALSVALLPTQHPMWQVVEVSAAAIVLVLAVAATATRAVDRDHQLDHHGSDSRYRFRAVAIAGALVLVATAVGCLWMVDRIAQSSVAPAVATATRAVLVVQAILLIGLVITVWVLRNSEEPQRASEWQPFLGGWLTPLVSLLAVLLGGLLSAATNLAVARLFGHPSGVHLPAEKATSATLFVPDEAFAFAIGMAATLPALLIVALVLWRAYKRKVHQFTEAEDEVRAWYAESEQAPDDAVEQVARAWAMASLTDKVDVLVASVGLTWAVGVIAVEVAALLAVPLAVALSGVVDVLVTFGVGVSALTAAFLVGMLRSTYANPGRRRVVGALWDVATFWPRATHPLAPPCYAEQAVPEIVDRVVLLTGQRADHLYQPATQLQPPPVVCPSPVLITGYSQGSLIAPAVVAQLPPETINKVALLTLACPFRRLYGRAFPAYFSHEYAVELNQLLTAGGAPQEEGGQVGYVGKWRNIVRRTDYIGSWIFSPPKAPGQQLNPNTVDVACLDPPSLYPGPGGALAPIHYHSDWWQDPLTSIYAGRLIEQLKSRGN